MRTTIRINDDLFREVKTFAAQSGRTITAVIEDSLRETLARRAAQAASPPLKLKPLKLLKLGSLQPGVDLDDSRALLDLMEGLGAPP